MNTEVENIKWPVTFVTSDIGWIINPCSDQRRSFYFLIVVFYFFPTLNNGCLKCLLTNWMLYCCVYCRLYNNPSIHYTIQKNYKEELYQKVSKSNISAGGWTLPGKWELCKHPIEVWSGSGSWGEGVYQPPRTQNSLCLTSLQICPHILIFFWYSVHPAFHWMSKKARRWKWHRCRWFTVDPSCAYLSAIIVIQCPNCPGGSLGFPWG